MFLAAKCVGHPKPTKANATSVVPSLATLVSLRGFQSLAETTLAEPATQKAG
jgi:hypothetical protein